MQQSRSSGSTTRMVPSYIERLTIHDLYDRAEELWERLDHCILCPRECRARRTCGRYGVCRSTDALTITSAGPHFGEEPPLVGWGGSGTIFLTSCNLKCAFCQNYEISQLRMGHPVSISDLATIMLNLQQRGCHNINLVTPTHFTPHIVKAIAIAAERGLSLPIVYNCGGYESVKTLKLLRDIIDIYMPDIKYSDNLLARKYSGAPNYWDIVQAAVREMQEQVGDLRLTSNGIAFRGLIIRHLVLPNEIAGSRAVLDFIAQEISTDAYVNIMEQYRPTHRAYLVPELNRRITVREFTNVLEYAREVGLHRGFEWPETILN
jgi:putative pyruvate formate lyase activating enzyme